MSKKTICLNMIVKNEAHIITETLDNVYKYIDYWVICDTGSTDNTKELITNFFKDKNIPGELYDVPWKNFGYNRSVALEKAYNKSDYVFIFDADDLVVGNLQISKTNNADAYLLKIGGNDFSYVRPLILNNRLKWGYKCVLHEYVVCINRRNHTEVLLDGDYYIDSRRLGNRNKDINKYKKDVQTILDALKDETEPGIITRYYFYLAQSYKDAKDDDNAIKYYQQRINRGGWLEEVYISHLEIGLAMIRLNYDSDKIIKSFMKGIMLFPERSECGYYLALYYYDCNDLINAYKTMMLVINIKPQMTHTLFVQNDILYWKGQKLLYDIGNDILKRGIKINLEKNQQKLYEYLTTHSKVPKHIQRMVYVKRNGLLDVKQYDNYIYIPNRDSYGNDISCNQELSLDELKELSDKDENCVGFNTLGYFKSSIECRMMVINDIIYNHDGLYIKRNKIKGKITNTQIDDYEFIANKDTYGNDIGYYPDLTLEQLKNLADINDECVGFNTYGYLKSKINDKYINLYDFKYEHDGLFVKKNNHQNDYNIDGYTYYPCKDSMGNDIGKYEYLSIDKLKQMSDLLDDCAGFNTFGILKYKINDELMDIPEKKKMHGIYIKNNYVKRKVEHEDYNFYNKTKIDEITNSLKNKTKKMITFTITTCKRFNLFEKTMNSFINCCKDIDLIDEYIGVDDNSSIEDRTKMMIQYPFIRWIFKENNKKGHAMSMNILIDEVKTKYMLHMEDDWLFYDCKEYIRPALEILNQDNIIEIDEIPKDQNIHMKKIKQVTFNKNYMELEEHHVCGGYLCKTQNGYPYLIHEYYDVNSPVHQIVCKKYNHNCLFWPHYTLQPSLLDTDIFKIIGYYDMNAPFFERKYAKKYYDNNFVTCFFTNLSCKHIGRLLREKGDNAYILNNIKQFESNKVNDVMNKVICINKYDIMDDIMINMFKQHSVDNYEFVKVKNENSMITHYNIWQQLTYSTSDFYVIFENNIVFVDDFHNKFKNILSKIDHNKHDIIFLGHKSNINEVEVKICELDGDLNIDNVYSYIITKQGAKKLIEYIKSNNIQDPDLIFENVNKYVSCPNILVKSQENINKCIPC